MRLILFIVILFLTMCTPSKNINYNNFKTLNSKWTQDDDLINKYNANNKIYRSNRQFIYAYYYLDSLDNKFCCEVYQNDFAKKNKIEAGRLAQWKKKDSTQVDKIRLYVYKGKSDKISYKEETLIKYDYFNLYKKKGFLKEITGVVEDSKGVYLHPVRNLCFTSLYLLAYPRVKYPLEIGKSWEVRPRTLKYVNEHVESYGYDNVSLNLKFGFEIVEKTIIKTPLKNLNCYKIEGRELTDMEISNNIAHFYFNEEYGFVKQVYYDAIKKTTLVIELEDVIDPE